MSRQDISIAAAKNSAEWLLPLTAAIRRNWLTRLAFAALLFGASTTLRFYADTTLPSGFPFLTYLPAVLVTAFLAGPRTAALLTLASAAAARFWFMEPGFSFSLDAGKAIALCFFAFTTSVTITLIHFMQRAAERLAAEREITGELYERQNVMFAEMQHRVANNLSFVGSLLSLQRRTVERDPARASAIFDDAVRRIESMSRLHRRLYTTEAIDTPIAEHFEQLGQDLIELSGRSDVAITVDAVPARLPLPRLVTLSMLIAEVATNSLKHAFEQAGGRIAISLRSDGADFLLTVTDDGAGMPTASAETMVSPRSGLGKSIIAGFARQLGGTIVTRSATDDGRGLVSEVRFPATA